MPDARVVSLNHRLRNVAAEASVAVQRIRNRYVFHRVLARLSSDPAWILKGGFALECRLGLRARSTKDLDVLLEGREAVSVLELQDLLDEALEMDLGDGFTFDVPTPRPVRAEDVEPATWRVVITARCFGDEFGKVVIDVVLGSAGDESVDVIELPTILDERPVPMRAIDTARHAAEKFHAYARIYAAERPSSRVKDLVDIVLLSEAGLLEPGSLGSAIRQVFRERDGSEAPTLLPDPPRDWGPTFTRMAAEIDLAVSDVDDGLRVARELYEEAVRAESESK